MPKLSRNIRLSSNQDNTDDLSMSSPMQHSSPTGEEKEYMTTYTITSGQGGPTGPEQVKKPDLAVSDTAIRQHIETKVNDINSFLMKLAALENKSRLLKDCLAGKREPPEEWRTARILPILPAGIHYSFSTKLDIDSLQSDFDKAWMSKLERDISDIIIPRQQTKMASIISDAERDIIMEMGDGRTGQKALELFKEEVKKRQEGRTQTYTEGQQNVAAAAKRRKFQSSQRQPRGPLRSRDPNQRQPPRPGNNNRYANKPNFKKAGWTSSRDGN